MLRQVRLRVPPSLPKHATAAVGLSTSPRTMPLTTWTPNKYPPARRSDHVDVYKSEAHGQVSVADPYQWLEQNTTETEEWTSIQERFTRSYLDKNADRQKLEDAFRTNTDYAKVKRMWSLLADIGSPPCRR
jgi:prolyl oligopeptidase